MQIDLDEKILEHFERAEKLAREATADRDESYSSRASALSALTKILNDLTKSRSEVINMKRLSLIEASTIETLKEYLTEEQQTEFLNSLEAKLDA